MAGSSLTPGRVLWATIPDQRGVNPKSRPLILLLAEEEVPAEEPLPVVVVSHTFPNPLPDDHVLLPYSNDRNRPAVTGLTMKSAAVCSWLTAISRDEIHPDDVGGIIPASKLEMILQKIGAEEAGSSDS